MGSPISPPPIREYLPEYLPAYLSNGLLGLRVGPIPLRDGICIVGGLVGRDPVAKVEAFARAPYPLAGDISVNGMPLHSLSNLARFEEQRYDFSCGELTTRFRYRVGEVEALVEVLTFCSRTQPTLVLQEVKLTVDAECSLEIAALVDPGDVAGRYLTRSTMTPGSEEAVVDGHLSWEPHGGLTRCGIAYITRFDGGEGVERWVDDQDELGPLRTAYRLHGRPGRTYVLRQ
ncbi:MAG: hypothetical protein J2P58_15620, partial [Acidimicrobiaceae bacterium]|nr:hypothetical protein [Acidimicrobiaceae bacterium]